ncbi:hypothetical protein [Desulfovermiculus halophilus]|uniref:hypothetical protein n=1 Tax=Desulfovermiculus halophilus TaxID=339722 RepID=UPI000485F499|nr:hypothetical protein [Desulfovermiculus halophilus]
MRNLNDKYYKALKAHERVVLSVEAEARGDDDELHRIKDTAPKKLYEQLEHEYVDTMMQLCTVSIAFESDMLSNALTFAWAFGSENSQLQVAAEKALQTIANLEAGRKRIFADLGVSTEAADAYGPKRHPVLEHLVSVAPEPNGDDDKEIERVGQSLPVVK